MSSGTSTPKPGVILMFVGRRKFKTHWLGLQRLHHESSVVNSRGKVICGDSAVGRRGPLLNRRSARSEVDE